MPRHRYAPKTDGKGSRSSSTKPSTRPAFSPWRGLLDSYSPPANRSRRWSVSYGSRGSPSASVSRSSSTDVASRSSSSPIGATSVQRCRPAREHSVVSSAAPMNEEAALEEPATVPTLSLVSHHGKAGCAFYEPDASKIVIAEDVDLRMEADTTVQRKAHHAPMSVEEGRQNSDEEAMKCLSSFLERVYMQAFDEFAPRLVLLSDQCDAALRGAVLGRANEVGIKVQTCALVDFDVQFLKSCLKELGLVDHHFDYIAGSSISLEGLQKFPLAASVLSALLSHIARVTRGSPAHLSCFGLVTTVELVSFVNFLQIDKEAQKALGLFHRPDALPTREMTVESLFNNIVTSQGKETFRRWLSRPTMDTEEVKRRQDAVSCFLQTNNAETAQSLSKLVRGAKNVARLLTMLSRDVADVNMWKHLAEAASNCIDARHCLQVTDYANVNVLVDYIDLCDEDALGTIRKVIRDVIDWNASGKGNHIVVRAGVDADLDKWQETLTNLPDVLSIVADGVNAEVKHYLGQDFTLNVEYFPQLGYFVAITRTDRSPVGRETIEAGESLGLRFGFSSADTAFFKNQRMCNMDDQVGDLHSLILGREMEIIQQLRDEILRHAHLFKSCTAQLAEIECLLAFAGLARKNGYCRPRVVAEPILEIENGRHALQELLVDEFVPNDTVLGPCAGAPDVFESSQHSARPRENAMVITGANACGKSVYMKQNALLVILAQIGSFVPAKRATIGIVDRIFACLPMPESSSSLEGSFSRDMSKLADTLSRSTFRSLVILDEVGKGTLPNDGAAIFAATLRHLLKRGTSCPRVLAATHFHEVFHDNLLGPSWNFQPAHMQVVLDKEDEHQEDVAQIVFLYKLARGLELTSHASQCEKICGLPQPIIERAAYVARRSRQHQLNELQWQIRQDCAALRERDE